MENKKMLQVSCAICDVRHITEELLNTYAQVEINSTIIITNREVQTLLGQYGVKLNASTTLNLEEDVRFASFNGSTRIYPGQTMTDGRVFLLVNGTLDIESGSEEILKNYAGIMVNGSLTCPESMTGFLSAITVNGAIKTYPDGCIRLKKSAELDRFFHLRAKQDALYYADRRMIALAPDVDFEKLAEKNVRFSTPKLLVAEALAEAAVPLFDEETDIVVLPDGCAYVNDNAELDETLVKRYGGKLYIAGDLSIGSKAEDVLDQVSFLRLDGDLLVTRSLRDRVLSMDVEYGDVCIVGGTVLSNFGSHNISAYVLENAEGGVSAVNCAHISIDADVTPELLREKLVSIVGCASISCATKEQVDVVALLARDVASISLNGCDEEEDEKDKDDENVVKINSVTYTF